MLLLWMWCFLIAVVMSRGMKVGDCSADVAFNFDVDTEALDAEGRNSSMLLATYRVTSPFRCITDCCDTESCKAVTYVITSDSNCFQYWCKDFSCPVKSSGGKYMYHIHHHKETTTDFTITAHADGEEVEQQQVAGSGTGANLQTTTRPPPTTGTPTTTVTNTKVNTPSTTMTTFTLNSSTVQPASSTTIKTNIPTISSTKPTLKSNLITTLKTTLKHKAAETYSLATWSILNGSDMIITNGSSTESASIATLKHTYGLLVTFAVFGFIMIFATVYVVSNRINESLKNYRYGTYRKVEYLINDRRMLA